MTYLRSDISANSMAAPQIAPINPTNAASINVIGDPMVPDWSKYGRAYLSELPAVPPRQDNCGELSRSRFFIPDVEPDQPTSFDRNLGLSAVLFLGIVAAVAILYLSYRITEFLFGS